VLRLAPCLPFCNQPLVSIWEKIIGRFIPKALAATRISEMLFQSLAKAIRCFYSEAQPWNC
jgi:hypothetical protein